ncbi:MULTISPECIES: GlxA family transcriptional regulator [Brucella]|uniref:GlxA family transcriptional regulator n=1 Tax=Brucella TaxID=234 RepID=UPI0011AB6053|nr:MULTISPECIES: GlxA family transcriptional regulator [Brucella]MRN42795.1 helix-turn-helix domain-containing protein [Brucella sp. 09RB8913]MRN58023.1 helix-turn-helix domain-containing protein [Brucella sp. 09RB8918]MRN78520.1 helix-turn-helix domain-containing protein [Brucella sp. 10RB9210]
MSVVNETGRGLGGKTEATADVPPRRLSVGIVVLPGFTLSALSLFLDPFRLAADDRDKSRQIRCAWKICTLSGDPVTSSSGMVIEPTVPLGEIDECDYVAVVGGLLAQYRHSQQALIDLIKRADKRGKAVVGLCTAAFLLAEAGVLEDRNCCVSWFHRDDFLELFDGYTADTTSLFHLSGRHYTCAGGLGAAALALSIIQNEISEELARKSASILLIPYELVRSEQPALSFNGVRSPMIRKAIRIFEETLEDPVPMIDVARRLGISVRQMERGFRLSLGRTAFEVREELRVKKAKELLAETSLSLLEVAVASGFTDTRSMNRSFSRQKQKAPRDYRRQR